MRWEPVDKVAGTNKMAYFCRPQWPVGRPEVMFQRSWLGVGCIAQLVTSAALIRRRSLVQSKYTHFCYGALAQLGEHGLCKSRVSGSSPLRSTFMPGSPGFLFLLIHTKSL